MNIADFVSFGLYMLLLFKKKSKQLAHHFYGFLLGLFYEVQQYILVLV